MRGYQKHKVQTGIVHPVHMDWICKTPFVLSEARLKWTVLRECAGLMQAETSTTAAEYFQMEVGSQSIYILFAWKHKINITHFNTLVTELSGSSFTLSYLS